MRPRTVWCAALIAAAGQSIGQSVTLDAQAEATIFDTPTIAIGQGRLFVGTNLSGQVRRGLVRFDLSSLPAGEVTSAMLTVRVTDRRGSFGIGAHRLLTDWNEGPAPGQASGGQGSAAGTADATWLQTGLGGMWATPGGDFVSPATDTRPAVSPGLTISFNVTPDAAAFAANPAQNFGWIFVSNDEGDGQDVISFDTDDEGAAVTLTVVIEPAACPADVNGDGAPTPADFSAWVAAFNAQAPGCDQNADGSCTPADFSAWIANFNAGCP
jgi:hypothetical protein